MEKAITKERALSLCNIYKDNLLLDVIPFWEKYSIDKEHGGYFTCLDKQGNIYDKDKFMWLQARQVWTFSMLYNRLEKKETWLRVAENGFQFLKKHGRDKQGSFFFSLDKEGTPLTYAYNIYADCFAALGMHEYAKASEDEEALEIALTTYHRYLARLEKPKGSFEKTINSRPLESFGLPMMTAYLTYELEGSLDHKKSIEIYEKCVNQILHKHHNKETGLIHEYVSPNGHFMDTFEGRLINPGHGIEAMWFLMDIAVKLDRPQLINQATDICLNILEHSWDKQHDGIFYFMDSKGAPPLQLEWDQKLWWVHLEALIALSRAYLITNRTDVLGWYHKVHDYTWAKFPDPDNGEWFGYLTRQGTPLTTLKGGKWKGCFHVPRALYECWRTWEQIEDKDKESN